MKLIFLLSCCVNGYSQIITINLIQALLRLYRHQLLGTGIYQLILSADSQTHGTRDSMDDRLASVSYLWMSLCPSVCVWSRLWIQVWTKCFLGDGKT